MGKIVDLSGKEVSSSDVEDDPAKYMRDIILTDGGGVMAIQCPACKDAYLLAFAAERDSDWRECQHCQQSRAMVDKEGKFILEVSTGIAKS